jgi:MFS family permease/anti-sigma regulatory factor (Ser/Thr protein kinase)
MSTHTVELDASPDAAQIHLQRPAFGIVAALFCGYLAIGLPLPVLPLFVRDRLGFSNLIVGLVVGIQFLATVLTRGYAGRVIDHQGGKRSALQGVGVCALAGLLYSTAAMPSLSPRISLAVLILGRLIAGFGEGQFVTGCVSWSIASVGPKRAGESMSWTGIAMFAALAIGAPVGMALYRAYGLEIAMVSCIVAPIIAAMIAIGVTSYATPAGKRLPFYRVIGQIWREGLGLMLQGVGLSGLTAFASLYFAAHAWNHAGLVMTAFGVGFIFVRVALGSLPDRIGGYRVALWSFLTEAIGQMMVWFAPNEIVALTGALVTGLGCALVFPALGVEALKRVLPANRGSAMGAFVAFLDIAYGFAGPAAGLTASRFGYAAVYLLGAASALLGAATIVSAHSSEVRQDAHINNDISEAESTRAWALDRKEKHTGKSLRSKQEPLVRRGMDQALKALQGVRSCRALTSLEKALSSIRQELTANDATRLRIVVAGQARELDSTVEDQLLLVIREALTNALRHSQASNIEAEIEYLSGRLRAAVRDNGIGMDPELLHDGRKSHSGLTRMCAGAERIGAQFRLWSNVGAGTEVEISLPS